MNDNRLAKYVLLYAAVIALATLIYAYNAEKKNADKALDAFNNIALSAVTGILGYLTAKNDNNDDYNTLLDENQRLLDELNKKN